MKFKLENTTDKTDQSIKYRWTNSNESSEWFDTIEEAINWYKDYENGNK